MRWLTLSSRVKSPRVRIKMNAALKKRKKNSSSSRRGDKKTKGAFVRLLAPPLILLLVAGGSWWAWGSSNYFTVRRIEIINNHSYSPGEVIAMAGLETGENIFRQKFSRHRLRLLEEVNIRDAGIERVFPDTIRVKIWEREPRARVRFGRYYTIDAWGVVLRGRKEESKEGLPVVTGLKVRDGFLYPEKEGEECLALLRELERQNLNNLLTIEEILMGEGELVVMRAARGLEIKLRKGDYRRQLDRLALILPHLENDSRSNHSVDLRFAHVPVVFED